MPFWKRVSNVLGRLHLEYRAGLWRLYRRFRRSVTVATRQGVFALPLEVDDPISKSLFIAREYELELMADAMQVIRSVTGSPKGKGAILDVGANNGVISIGMLIRGEVESAIAIEPDPRNFSILRRNVALNRLDGNICCLNCAVSDKSATLSFELSQSNYGDHRVRGPAAAASKELYDESRRHVIPVESKPLDSLLADVEERFRKDLSLVWIDVQGHEGQVFRGGRGLFSQGVPVVSEIWPYGIRRSGLSREDFCGAVGEIWSAYRVRRGNQFVAYPIDQFHKYWDELGCDGAFDNVIFTR